MENGLIASALLTMDQSSFQELMADFLNARGYKLIGKPGGVAGKNKTKSGTPDVFFVDNQNNYAYCECTTRERLPKGNEFLKKLLSDIAHCFSESPKSVPRDRITCVILCCTGEILPNEDLLLRESVQGYQPGCKLELYTIGNLPTLLSKEHHLLEKYFPHLARTKRIVMELKEFLRRLEGRVQPSHSGQFVGREKEVEGAIEALKSHNVMLLSGSQGVGKSRLAVQAMVELEKEGFIPLVIEGDTGSILDDLTRLFSHERKYVVLVDDANRGINNMVSLLRFIETAPVSSIKVIITVREYQRPLVEQYIGDWKIVSLRLEPIEDLVLSKLIEKNIPKGWHLNQVGIRMIVGLSKGNPRIALMSLKSMFDSGGKGVFDNVFEIYEKYFNGILRDVSFMSDKKKLIALGVLSFFEHMDRNDRNLREFLSSQIHFSWEELWETFNELDAMELVDLHDRELVKISDAVLATYSFYKTFIEPSTAMIDYGNWLGRALRAHPAKVRSSIFDCIQTFGYHSLKPVITAHTSKILGLVTSEVDLGYHFFDAFWFYHELNALSFVNERINGLENTADNDWSSAYGWNYGQGEGRILTILGYFWENDLPLLEEAIKLGLRLYHPTTVTALEKKFEDCFKITQEDCNHGYSRQMKLVNILSSDGFNGNGRDVIDKIFLHSTQKFLDWESRVFAKASIGNNYLMNTFTMVPTAELTQFRMATLRNLFRIALTMPTEVFARLDEYVQHALNAGQCPAKEEVEMVATFLFQFLDETNYAHDQLIQQFKELTKGMSPNPFDRWKGFQALELASLIQAFKELKEEDQVSGPEDSKGFNSFRDFVASLSKADLRHLIDQIERESRLGNVDWDIQLSFKYLLRVLVENDLLKYQGLLNHAMTCDYQMGYSGGEIVTLPITLGLVEPQEYYKLLNAQEYESKTWWILLFFESIPEERINDFIFEEFVTFILNIESGFNANDSAIFERFDRYFQQNRPRLIKFTAIDSLFVHLVECLFQKRERMFVFFGYRFCEKYGQNFKMYFPLLKAIYIHQRKINQNYSQLKSELQAICEIEHCFVVEFLSESFSQDSSGHIGLHGLKFDFIWDWLDCEEVLDQVFEVFIQNNSLSFYHEPSPSKFFKGVLTGEARYARAWDYLIKRTAKFAHSNAHLRIIMNIVASAFPERVITILREMLLANHDIKLLEEVRFLEPDHLVHGSMIPEIKKKIKLLYDGLEMIKGLPNPLNYVKHEAYLQSLVEEQEWDRKWQLKQDFRDGE